MRILVICVDAINRLVLQMEFENEDNLVFAAKKTIRFGGTGVCA